MSKVLRTIVLVVALMTAAQASAEIYKWVDENGVTHYGQKPPTAQTAEAVGVATKGRAIGTRRVPKETREKLGISDSLVRLSVGIENADDLEEDLARALEAV